MYTETNFKTKKAFREALAAGREIYVFQPDGGGGIFPERFPAAGSVVAVEGPHFSDAHKWYASVVIDSDGKVLRIEG